MLLSELLRDVEYIGKIEDVEIKDVTGDSRRVEPGSVFVCIKGGNIDGHEYAAAAKRNGASWIVAERDTGIPEQIIVPNKAINTQINSVNFQLKLSESKAIPYVDTALPMYVQEFSTPDTVEIFPYFLK